MKKIALYLLILSLFFSAPAFALLQLKTGKATVSSAGTAVALTTTDTYYYDLTVCGNSANIGAVAVGPQNVIASATDREGVQLLYNGCHTFTAAADNSLNGNLKDLYVDAVNSNDKITFLYRQVK